MNIGILTLDIGDLNYSSYSIDNTENYCQQWGYDFIHCTSLYDPSMAIVSNKILWINEHIDNYDYIFLKDLDSLFYDFNKSVESYIDVSSDYILSASRYGNDHGNTGHIIFKNSEKVKGELDIFISELQKVVLKGDQMVFNILRWRDQITDAKILKKNIFNSSVIPTKVWDPSTFEILNEEVIIDDNCTLTKFSKGSWKKIDSDLSDETFIIHFFGNLNREKQGDFNLTDDQLNTFINYYNTIKNNYYPD